MLDFELSEPLRANAACQLPAELESWFHTSEPVNQQLPFSEGEILLDAVALEAILDSHTSTDTSTQIDSGDFDSFDQSTQTRNACRDLNFSANRGCQTMPKKVQDVNIQTERFKEVYSGPMPLPAGISVPRLVHSVVDHPQLPLRTIARQLATLPTMLMVEDESLGLIEAGTHIVECTVAYIRQVLQILVDREQVIDPSGSSALDVCSQFLDTLGNRPV
jgi:hypothetical protein